MVFGNHCREKIFVPSSKPYITLQGGGWNNTILQWNDTADTVGKNGEELGTFGSASVAVEADYFIARNITFKVTVYKLYIYVYVYIHFIIFIIFSQDGIIWS